MQSIALNSYGSPSQIFTVFFLIYTLVILINLDRSSRKNWFLSADRASEVIQTPRLANEALLAGAELDSDDAEYPEASISIFFSQAMVRGKKVT